MGAKMSPKEIVVIEMAEALSQSERDSSILRASNEDFMISGIIGTESRADERPESIIPIHISSIVLMKRLKSLIFTMGD
jgi:hypothetical protein